MHGALAVVGGEHEAGEVAVRQVAQAATGAVAVAVVAQEIHLGQHVDAALLQDAAEQALARKVAELEVQLAPLFAAGDYQQALTLLAGLRDVVDTFFEKVMVMAEDEALRLNRLTLLSRLRNLFLEVADISVLQK